MHLDIEPRRPSVGSTGPRLCLFSPYPLVVRTPSSPRTPARFLLLNIFAERDLEAVLKLVFAEEVIDGRSTQLDERICPPFVVLEDGAPAHDHAAMLSHYPFDLGLVVFGVASDMERMYG